MTERPKTTTKRPPEQPPGSEWPAIAEQDQEYRLGVQLDAEERQQLEFLVKGLRTTVSAACRFALDELSAQGPGRAGCR